MHHAMSEHELLSATERNELDRAGGRASGDGRGADRAGGLGGLI